MPIGRVGRIALIVTFGVAALAACGDDEDSAPTATSAPVATTTPTVQRSMPASPVAASPAASPAAASPIAADAAGATIVLTDYRINVFQASFQVGQPYTFVVQNNGSQTHEFVIEGKGATDQPLRQDSRRAEILEVPAGGIATLTWTFSQPGDYQIACHRDGHYDKGMVQDIAVQRAP